MKKINFVLPAASGDPIGGYKVIFEYVNKLISDGYKVNIILPSIIFWEEQETLKKIKGVIRYIYFKIRDEKYLPYSWFPLDRRVKIYWVPTLEEKYIPKGDYIFATAVQTAEYVNKYSFDKGEKFYFIQSFEEWALPRQRVLKTWKTPLKKIVISKYLLELAENLNEEAIYIENGLNFKKFFKELIEKVPFNLIMLYHLKEEVKQSNAALNRIKNLKKKFPQLTLTLFGTSKKPKDLPNWISYYQKPDEATHRRLYNQAQIFISPSKIEGWALPPAEAMQCGTCVCVTDIPGHEYIEHMKTGYLIKNIDYLEESIEFLLKNPKKIEELSNDGHIFIQKFTWDKAYDKLKKYVS